MLPLAMGDCIRSGILALIVMDILALFMYLLIWEQNLGVFYSTRTVDTPTQTGRGTPIFPARSMDSQIKLRTVQNAMASELLKTVKFNGMCSPVERIFFLKIQKAGSTTLSNILHRFGIARNLSFIVFSEEGFRHPTKHFKQYSHPNQLGNGFDIFSEHSIYDREIMDQTMKTSYKRIAIIREPLSQLRSYVKFFGYDVKLGLEEKCDPAGVMLKQVSNYSDMENVTALRGINMTFSWNWVAEQFGYDDIQPENVFLAGLDSDFHIVLILEKFEESLVLMKRKFCWNLKDILYAQMRKSDHVRVTRHDAELRNILVKYSHIDYTIYNHFRERLQQEILQETNDFAGEVNYFREISEIVHVFCNKICHSLGEGMGNGMNHSDLEQHLLVKQSFESSRWGAAFYVHGWECLMMRFGPGVYRQAFDARQVPNLCRDNQQNPWCRAERFEHHFPWSVLSPKSFLSECL